MLVYGLMIFGIEFIRLDSQKILGTRFSIEHIVAAVLIAAGMLILTDRIKKYRELQKTKPKSLNVGKKN